MYLYLFVDLGLTTPRQHEEETAQVIRPNNAYTKTHSLFKTILMIDTGDPNPRPDLRGAGAAHARGQPGGVAVLDGVRFPGCVCVLCVLEVCMYVMYRADHIYHLPIYVGDLSRQKKHTSGNMEELEVVVEDALTKVRACLCLCV